MTTTTRGLVLLLLLFCLATIESVRVREVSRRRNRVPVFKTGEVVPVAFVQLSTTGDGDDWQHTLAPVSTDAWANQHMNDIRHMMLDAGTEIPLRSFDRYRVPEEKKASEDSPPPTDPWFFKNRGRSLSEELNPEGPVIHPAVQPMAPRPGDSANGLADYDEAPPDPMAPTPPYLFPPKYPGEFDYNVPPAYKAFYPTAAPSETNQLAAAEECVPVSKMPNIRSQLPTDLQKDDYCIPSKYVPAGYDDGTEDGNMFSSPQFSLPTPFSAGPIFPPFHPLGSGIPHAPIPAPFSSNADPSGRTPTMPMVPLPPAMWPYA